MSTTKQVAAVVAASGGLLAMGFATGTMLYFRRVRLNAHVPRDEASTEDVDIHDLPLDDEAKERATPVAKRALAWATLGTMSSASALVAAGWMLWPKETKISNTRDCESEGSTNLESAAFAKSISATERTDAS
mmetsp:Transcript_7848/g.48635  ORF Transcript_7848/g.48635 Transcript_7848/m.48635 type:complete len:133 (-) Transcript_7848:2175-2573(-)